MKFGTFQIPNLKSVIYALSLLALIITLTPAQNGNIAKPTITFAVIGDTGTSD